MAQQSITGGDGSSGQTGEQIKDIINNNFTELYNRTNRVVLTADVTNNNATPDTLQDITGLSFPVEANKKYWFRYVIPFTTPISTTGSRWAVNGPALTSLVVYTRIPLAATSTSQRFDNAYDGGAVSATSLSGLNIVVMEGFIECSSVGAVIARFSSEVASSAVIAKIGAFVEYFQLN